MSTKLAYRAVLDVALSYAIGLRPDSLADGKLLLVEEESNTVVVVNSGR